MKCAISFDNENSWISLSSVNQSIVTTYIFTAENSRLELNKNKLLTILSTV